MFIKYKEQIMESIFLKKIFIKGRSNLLENCYRNINILAVYNPELGVPSAEMCREKQKINILHQGISS